MSYSIDITHRVGGLERQNILATLVLDRAEILDDVAQYTYIEGDIKATDDEHDRHQVMDAVQEGNIDRVQRVLNLAYQECLHMLYPYAKQPLKAGMSCTDTLMAAETYVIQLELPISYDATTLSYLEALVHEYLTNRIVADWLSITSPQSAQNWLAKLEEVKKKISSALSSRARHTRRPMQPF